MNRDLNNSTAIAGIGATEFTKNAGRSELALAAEAVLGALDDAGLRPSDVDGFVTYTSDPNSEIDVARAIGANDLTFFSRVHYGGGAACAVVQQAAMAVHSGIADVVVCYRALRSRSGSRRFGHSAAARVPLKPTTETVNRWDWTLPYGLSTPASWVAMQARRYMYSYGVTSADFGQISVAARRHAATNPKAYFYNRPITIEDHQNSKWIAEPLRLLDCCQESDGAVAIVVTSLERARDLAQTPAAIAAAAQGSARDQQTMVTYYRPDISGLPEMGVVARQLYATAGVGPTDISTAVIYDHFTPFVLTQLEEFGFCGRGEAKDYIAGGRIELGGALPINTNGGQLGEAYVHGMNGVAEAVRQIRGTAVNQVPDAAHVLVTAGTGVPTSGLILGHDPAGRG
ncbi:MAG: 17-hydroxy-3-oxo-4-pregnene-20-carboxyl-CoA lyase [Micromonosporaceae bacterium]|nr:17-hydroxy-3-oxo-4-pregnene-20-carboxyl-CoA lyase [Micromonosporaceae bacterium]